MEVKEMADGSVKMTMDKEQRSATLESVEVKMKDNGYVICKHYDMGGDYGYQKPKEYVTKSSREAVMYVADCLGVTMGEDDY